MWFSNGLMILALASIDVILKNIFTLCLIYLFFHYRISRRAQVRNPTNHFTLASLKSFLTLLEILGHYAIWIFIFLFSRHPYESFKKNENAWEGIQTGNASNSLTSGMLYEGIFLKYIWIWFIHIDFIWWQSLGIISFSDILNSSHSFICSLTHSLTNSFSKANCRLFEWRSCVSYVIVVWTVLGELGNLSIFENFRF